MKYYIIAGEASGDLHASNLMKSLKSIDAKASFRCWGGDLMMKQGAVIVKHYKDLAFMGFAEVIANLSTIIANLRLCKQDIINYNPDALILVDYPGFNLRIAEFAKKKGFKVFYYISPQVWAWKKSRVYSIKKYVDRMFVILPFEKPFYAKYDYEVDFVGHPLLDMIENLEENDQDTFRSSNGLTEKPIIALLPGSRKQEIRKMLSEMLSVVSQFDQFEFVIAGAPSIDEEFYDGITGEKEVKIVHDQTHRLLQNAYAALVTSGTATLETALFEIPEVVCYKGSFISYQIAKRIVDRNIIRFISLVNLIMDREIVKELIQDQLNTPNLIRELKLITENNENRNRLKKDYKLLKEKLGGSGASENTARAILNYIST